METTENFELTGADQNITLGPEAHNYLRESGKWAVFLGIIGFIFTGFLVIGALSIGAILSAVSRLAPENPMGGGNPGLALIAGMGGFLTVIYLLVALVYFFFSLYLYQFGSKVKKGIMYFDSLHVTDALGKLKSFFKLWGIITIVILSLYALMIICFIIFGAAAASMMGR